MAELSGEWTQGPWFPGEELQPMGGCMSRAVLAQDTYIAEVLFDDEDDATAEANTHLIAAAPELAEALHDLQQHVIKHACTWDAAENGSHNHPIWTKVSAALSKAQGGAR